MKNLQFSELIMLNKLPETNYIILSYKVSYSLAYLEPSLTSTMKLFCEKG